MTASVRGSRRRIEDLRQAEVEHFHRPVSTHFDIRGLQVAVNDPVIVGRFERFRDLPGDRPRLIEWKRAPDETVRQRARRPVRGPAPRAVRFLKPVDGCNVGMIECRENLRFPSEPRQTLRIEREGVGKTFSATSRPRFVSRAR